ncbi:MAG: hypothetical protein K9J33_16860 [Bacteroidales bacterium]|nr:hypothetical protein [Bacteroidales bacterium]
MEEKELLESVQAQAKTNFQIVQSPYWTAEIYSFGKYIRKYGYYPPFLPLCVYTDHGPGGRWGPHKHELESTAPTQLYHSPEVVERWHKYSKKKCYCMYSPAVYYRKSRKVKKAERAHGTIAFPAHTTPSIEDISDFEAYIDQLVALPEKFQPVSVCLHMHDINKGKYKPFLKHNIPIVTAGNTSDYRFIERFYEILRKYSYATSNFVGAYAYYAVELGIPFFIYGNKQRYINKSDPNIPVGDFDPYKTSENYKIAYDIFSELVDSVTQEQKELVETNLGIRDGITRGRMACVLYTSLLKYIFSRRGIRHIISSTKKRIQNRIKIATSSKER